MTDPLCHDCRVTADARELAAFREKEFKMISQELTTVAAMGPAQFPRLERILGEVFLLAGGEKLFAKKFWDQFQTALENRPGAHGNLQMFLSVFKLVMDVNKLQHQEELADMTDQQLRDQKNLTMTSILMEALGDPGKRQMILGVINSSTDLKVTDLIGVARAEEVPDGTS